MTIIKKQTKKNNDIGLSSQFDHLNLSHLFKTKQAVLKTDLNSIQFEVIKIFNYKNNTDGIMTKL